MQIKKENKKKKVLNSEAEVFRRSKLLGKYTAKILFEWDDGKFEDEYLKKLEQSWDKMERKGESSFSGGGTLRGGYYHSVLEH